MREPAAVEPTLEIGNEGKAARRLELFETARGVESTNVAPKQRTRRSRGESAPPDADLAATYAEVATEIASPPDAPAPAPGGGLGPPTPNGARSGGRSARGQSRTARPTAAGNRVNVSGRVSAIAVDPSNGRARLVGAADGGVWESGDRGATLGAAHRLAADAGGRRDRLRPRRLRRPSTAAPARATGGGGWARACCARPTAATTWARPRRRAVRRPGLLRPGGRPGERPRTCSRRPPAALYVDRRRGRDLDAAAARRRRGSLSQHPTTAAEILAACADGVFRSTNGGQTWTAVLPSGARRHPAARGRDRAVERRASPTLCGAQRRRQRLPVAARRRGLAAVTAPPDVSVRPGLVRLVPRASSPDNPGQIYCGAIDVYRGDLSGTRWTWTNIVDEGRRRLDPPRPARDRLRAGATATRLRRQRRRPLPRRPNRGVTGGTATTAWSSPSSSTSPRTAATPAG